MKKIRIDRLLVETGLVPTRERAQALIMAGLVLVDDVPAEKSGKLISPAANIRIKGKDHPFVSRGGVKLAHAISEFGIDLKDKVCMDVGASTGGFTDCMLQAGAARVYAVDVGYGQMDPKVASDERVVAIERTNIRTMDAGCVPEPVEFAAVDCSFISLAIVLPAIDRFLARGATVVAMVKPQFEVGKGLVGKGGIVNDPVHHLMAVEKAKSVGEGLGWQILGETESPILGAKGNREFFVVFQKL